MSTAIFWLTCPFGGDIGAAFPLKRLLRSRFVGA